MSHEIRFEPRNIEDPIQEIAFTELPWMLNMAQLWIDERTTLGSVTQAIKSGFYRKSEKYGYKTDFAVNFNYLKQAVEEAREFAIAKPAEKSGELGDILFLLLHFANGAEISADDVVTHLRVETLSNNQNTKLSLSTRLINSIFRKSSIPSIVEWYKESVGDDNIELLGAMSGDEAPWTLNRKSTEWSDYQQSLVSNWAIVFGTICQYSLENNIPLLETIYQTAFKASYNFPTPFFRPESTPFQSGPTANNREIVCCRLFRTLSGISDVSGKTFIEQYHSIFNEQKVVSSPQEFRGWVFYALLSIRNTTKKREQRDLADWLLHGFNWESLQ